MHKIGDSNSTLDFIVEASNVWIKIFTTAFIVADFLLEVISFVFIDKKG